MNTLLSIFHLLLMLTHNHLLPDMGSVWKQASTEMAAEKQITVNDNISIPTEQQQQISKEAICEENHLFLTPILYSQDPILFLLARQHTGWPRRQFNTIKRYLVFCQLKIGG